MVLGKRERILAIAAGALVALVAGRLLWSFVTEPIRSRQARLDSLEREGDKQWRRFRNLQRAKARLLEWNRRSLPSDPQTGRLLYENWLLETVEKAQFQNKRVESAESRPHRGLFVTFPYTIRGQANLEQLTKFLFDFYSAGHLHQIRRLTIHPAEKPPGFEIVMIVEAALMPNADRRDKLCERPSNRLGKTELSEYQKWIAQRNVFGAHVPAAVAASPLDPARFVYVTGITEKDGKAQVWMQARMSGEKFTFSEGEKFQMAGLQGTVKRIGQREVELEIDGKARVVPLGQNLQPRSGPPSM